MIHLLPICIEIVNISLTILKITLIILMSALSFSDKCYILDTDLLLSGSLKLLNS